MSKKILPLASGTSKRRAGMEFQSMHFCHLTHYREESGGDADIARRPAAMRVTGMRAIVSAVRIVDSQRNYSRQRFSFPSEDAQVSAGSENMVPRWLTTRMSRSRMKSAAISPLTSRGATSPGPPAR
jgi:hypothetical protein